VLVANDIAPDSENNSFEDWWVCPELISGEVLKLMKCLTDVPKRADFYMLKKSI
jgi:hypothetical protein